MPEAQLDRFMFNIKMDYPSFGDEVDIVKRTTVESDAAPQVVLSSDEILAFQSAIRRMPVPDNVVSYAVSLAASTRPEGEGNTLAHKYLSWGAGPRASQYLVMGAKTRAAFSGKYSPDSEDVDAVATEVLRHRLVLNYYAEAEGVSTDTVISELKKTIRNI